MVIAGAKGSDGKWSKSTYKLIDIGQSRGVGGGLVGHDREECWNRSKPEGTSLLFKIAAIPTAHYDETDRRIIECCIRAQNRRLPCGTECNEGYDREDSVEITNLGSYLPLSPYYTCRVERA